MNSPLDSHPFRHRQFRQGDVLLIRIEALPCRLKRVRTQRGAIVLAEGEVTGHAHKLPAAAGVLLETNDGERFLRITQHTRLTHEEHDAIDMEPGLYAVVRQREYSPEGDSLVGD